VNYDNQAEAGRTIGNHFSLTGTIYEFIRDGQRA
jgi:hypothetical protein